MTPSPLSWVSSFMMERAASSARVHERPDSAEPILSIRGERTSGPISRTIGLYQMVLRRTLEHFFPDAQLEIMGDRSIIDWDGSSDETYYRVHDDPNGVGVEIEWLGSRLVFLPGNPAPLLSTERHLVSVIVAAIDLRFRGLFNQDLSHRLDRFQYQTEDLIVADYLDAVSPYRIPAALEALRVAALSTYENRRVSTGALLLGTEDDPAAPAYKNVEGAPSFNARLTAIKGFHRLCDGVRTVFLVDRQGDLARMIDVSRWAEAAQGCEPLVHPCPRQYVSHAKATRCGRPRLPGPHTIARDQGLRRGHAHVQLQRCAMAAARYPQQVRGLARGGRKVGLARSGFVHLSSRSQLERIAARGTLRRSARSVAVCAAASRAHRPNGRGDRRRRSPGPGKPFAQTRQAQHSTMLCGG